MFGFPRLQQLMADTAQCDSLNDFLLQRLADFTGPGWEQEDDVTLVTLQHLALPEARANGAGAAWRDVAAFEVESAPGNERQAMERIADTIAGLSLSEGQVERLKTAVAEATMNAMEHGNEYDVGKQVSIRVKTNGSSVRVSISDQGGGREIDQDAAAPDIDAKLAGEQTPRGWGLFLIEKMVDEVTIVQDETHHTVALTMNLGDGNGEGS
jgi:anti-sigma regulatory factor (Ser/Thr protein kinase)